MIDDQVILTIERLRDSLVELRTDLRGRYGRTDRQVTSEPLRKAASEIAEAWMIDIAPRPEINKIIPSDYLADLNVHFQRLLSFSEHASRASRYEAEIKALLGRFTVDFIIPLKQHRVQMTTESINSQTQRDSILQQYMDTNEDFQPTAFVGMSFAPIDKVVNDCITQTLSSLGITVVTGEKPKADRISEKVKNAIDGQHLFVGTFTRRDKVSRKNEWTTSSWVIDEKAYAVGKGKKLILLKERGVGSIGGIQGDYEYIEFSRDRLEDLVLALLNLFTVSISGLK
jgi:hypothetical protein